MWKATRRRLGSPAWLALGLVMLIPSLAEAQLFPDRTIRRVRPPCNQEPPFNAQVRRDYFGYYPTCWTRFPAGWACPCPNPELPNLEASIRERPLGRRPSTGEGEAGMDPANPPEDTGDRKPPVDNPNIPLPNGGRSPFELDPNPKPPGNAPGAADPFTAPNTPNPAPTIPPGRPSASTGALDMPKMPEITPSASFESSLQPGSMELAPDAKLASSDSSDVRPDLGPLPSQPVSMPNNLNSPSDPVYQPLQAAPAPAQAPRRRSFLSGLFGPRETRKR